MMRYLRTRGLRVPEDISVVSIDDVLISQFVSPPLTTMHIDRREMIQCGIEMLEQLLAGHGCENRMLSAPRLIVRESTAPIQ